MLTVHHLNHSRSWRVLWLLEELGVPYLVVNYERDPRTLRAPPSLRQIHPLGRAPVISDDRCILAETGAIVEYVVERYGVGRLMPPSGTQEHLRYTYWLHYAEGSAMPPLLLNLVFAQLPKAPMPLILRPIARVIAKKARASFVGPMLADHLDYLEGELDKSPWFAGPEFSAPDIQMSFPIEGFVVRGGLDPGRPRLWAWLERVRARPAYQRVVESVGALELLA